MSSSLSSSSSSARRVSSVPLVVGWLSSWLRDGLENRTDDSDIATASIHLRQIEVETTSGLREKVRGREKGEGVVGEGDRLTVQTLYASYVVTVQP